jgi:DNA-binding NarL/FixJ family response regulator
MRAVIADRSGLLLELMTESLARRGFDVSTTTDPSSVHRAAGVPPDVVVVALHTAVHHDGGVAAAMAIRAVWPGTGLLMLSEVSEVTLVVRLLEFAEGAVGYLPIERIRDLDQLVEAMRRVAAGEVVLDPDLMYRIIRRPHREEPLRRLTTVERQVLALVAAGRSNTAIARQLHYSVKTVEKRICDLTRKLGLPTADHGDRADVNLRVLAALSYLRARGEPA